MTSTRAPFPRNVADFANDARIYYDRENDSYQLEDENGEEWEWSADAGAWQSRIDDATIEKMQAQYKVEGVDENGPAVDLSKKRKAQQDAKAESSKKRKEEKEDSNTAIFVTGLPLDTDDVELHRVFSDCGPFAISLVDGKPRIKLYYNSKKEFIGEAFIVYQKTDSAAIAITKFNGTDFNRGPAVDGQLKVAFARKHVKAQQPRDQDEQAKDTNSGHSASRAKPKTLSKADRARRQAKEAEISLNWNRDSDSEDEDEGRARRARWDRLVILQPMFTLEELAADADAYDDIKQDVLDECSKFGKVTNLVLWDLEPRGVVTVRYADPDAAEECIKALSGRKFAEQPVRATLANGYESYKKKSEGNGPENNTADADETQEGQ